MKIDQLKCKSVLASIALLLLSSNCSQRFESIIRERIVKQCKPNSDCIISIKELTNFNWEKFYVFGVTTTLEDMNKALGFNYPYYKEFCRTLVFLENNQIIYHEENASNIERIENNEVVFNYSDSVKFACFTPSNAIFEVHKYSSGKGESYILTQFK
jgi:hypothetical protein